MLGVLCARHKPWILTSLSFVHHGLAAHHRLARSPIKLIDCGGGAGGDQQPRRHHSSACSRLVGSCGGGAASIWHAILPSGGGVGRRENLRQQKGEGSWNVAWDGRPARWLNRPDSAWLLFGVCACLAAPPLDLADVNPEVSTGDQRIDDALSTDVVSSAENNDISADYRVTGVPADGRCLFRAIAHVARLRNGEEAPDKTLQTELADKLRAQVVDELLKRRKETEWFIDGDFDAYVNRMREPYVWGGEPELLMASHVLRTPISVFMRDRSSGDLVKIANYGQQYHMKDEETASAIEVLFHGYGHYDILEAI